MDTFVLKVEQESGLKRQLRIVGPGERVVVERPLEGSKLDQFARDIQTSYGREAPPLSNLATQLSEWLTGSSNRRLDNPGHQSSGLTLHIETDHCRRPPHPGRSLSLRQSGRRSRCPATSRLAQIIMHSDHPSQTELA